MIGVLEKTMGTVKLGSKVDGFEKKGQPWFVATELQSDVIVEVRDVKFYLHRFPLLSRSGILNRLVFESRDTQKNKIQLDELPGGPEAFELAAKFCYGMSVDLNATNLAALWCAAVYLEMTESLEEGNLVSKSEAFFNLVVLGSWKDSVTVLQSCVQLLPWSEKLLIVQRCTESIAWKACTDPRGYRYPPGLSSRAHSPSDNLVKQQLVKDWWFDDVINLPVIFFTKVVEAIRVKGMQNKLVAAVVSFYAVKWLPKKSDFRDASGGELKSLKDRSRRLFKHIWSAFPQGQDVVPMKVLMSFIGCAYLLEANLACKEDLERRAGMQLESSLLTDLMNASIEVEVFLKILNHYLRHQEYQTRENNIAGKTRVANLVDGYLAEMSKDEKLCLSKFLSLAEALPLSLRPSHDVLYKAVNNFLKAHPDLTDGDRKKLCQILDCKKLSFNSCMHAAQNERLPLRTIMQVLFFEHLKLKACSAPAPNVEYCEQAQACFDPKQDRCAALQDEIFTLRTELKTMKAELAEFQSNFYAKKNDQAPDKPKGSKWKKLGRSFQNLSRF